MARSTAASPRPPTTRSASARSAPSPSRTDPGSTARPSSRRSRSQVIDRPTRATAVDAVNLALDLLPHAGDPGGPEVAHARHRVEVEDAREQLLRLTPAKAHDPLGS